MNTNFIDVLTTYHVEYTRKVVGYSWILVRTTREHLTDTGKPLTIESGRTLTKRGAVVEAQLAAFHDRLDRREKILV